MSLHLCYAPAWRYRRQFNCPTCARRRLFLVELAAWWGSTVTCLTCGDAWAEEGRLPRPFKPRWRAESIARAKALPFTTKAEALAGEFAYVVVDEVAS